MSLFEWLLLLLFKEFLLEFIREFSPEILNLLILLSLVLLEKIFSKNSRNGTSVSDSGLVIFISLFSCRIAREWFSIKIIICYIIIFSA
ncbi:hypothetical protein HYE14_03700 [Mycoplasmopsis bovis]|nr:hypothetical protein [Mycoplasmopsis bovis]QQH25877.1 hypothetical protein HYE14_03700 [Mycoplasmopsis bovis]QQH26917.1 hypothetical protein HYE09_03695 [Mycoplasmopsis bovis]QQH27159.1 hypothetical protein HYE08_03705 [Mycoplasmopsis bovis]